MTYVAAFDIGTTQAKGVLADRDGKLLLERNVPIRTWQQGGAVEQEPNDWLEAVVRIAAEWFAAGIDARDIAVVAMSGQMQDCIPVGADGEPVRRAILYSDGRAGEQAERLLAELGAEAIRAATGNHMDGTLTLPKLMWLREHEPEAYARADKILISAKDYVVRHLTGRSVTDPTTAATTGMMRLGARSWMTPWFVRFGLDAAKLPELLPADEIAGFVTAAASRRTGFAAGTPVLCGIGDAGAATIGAGLTRPGEPYAYIGTTGWVAALTPQVAYAGEGVFHLADVAPGMQIAIAPLTNAGNAHKWALEAFGDSGWPEGEGAFAALERKLQRADRGRNELLFLPYLNGERCPVQNPHAAGAMIGLRPTVTKTDMAVAVLEGVAMAMKQVYGLIAGEAGSGDRVADGHNSPANGGPAESRRITLIGGGSKSGVWNQIIADVFESEVAVPGESQFLPSLGAAALGFVRLGWTDSYEAFRRVVLAARPAETFRPNAALASHYHRKYGKFLKLYPALRELYTEDAAAQRD